MNVKQFDIVMIDFGDNPVGHEQGGKRPAVVIQNDIGNHHAATTLVMPVSTKLKNPNQPTHTLIKRGRGTGLVKDSIVLGECLRQVSELRILKYLGELTSIEDKREIKRVYEANTMWGDDVA